MAETKLKLISNQNPASQGIQDFRFFEQEDGTRGLTLNETADREPTESLYLSDEFALHVPVRYLDKALTGIKPVDGALKNFFETTLFNALLFRSVSGGGGDPIDCDFRFDRDEHGRHRYWEARPRTKFDDEAACIWADGRKYWQSNKEQYEAHMDDFVLSESQQRGLRVRLNAGLAFVELFSVLEAIFPPPFETLQVFMTHQKELGLQGDAGGKTFVRYLLENARMLELPGYPAEAKTSFYRFLRVWSRTRYALGMHFGIVRLACDGSAPHHPSAYRLHVSVMP
jgi:hypothetical protein